MKRRFVLGDIHGAFRALRQCLDRSAFDYVEDELIFLGDVSDGWPETRDCIEELLKIRNLTFLLGNHDFWTLEWMETGYAEDIWLQQGGQATIESYRNDIPANHHRLLKSARMYYESDRKLFVHAGFDPQFPVNEQSANTLLWDRTLARKVMHHHANGIDRPLTTYDEVYLGHTPVSKTPLFAGGVWMMDTAAGWTGVLSMMNIDSKEIFQSDQVPSLYPGIKGRQRF